jgi:type I restriction enzyme, S subunit
VHEVVTEKLDLWTSVLVTKSTAGRGNNGKQEAYGIKKLRELILELAVRGKLVPQDPKDEPASVLLARIAAEKSRLVKEGKIKKEEVLPEIMEDEKDYEPPAGWIFVRLGDIALSQAGFAFKSRFFNENAQGLPLIRIRDVGQPFTGTYYSGEYREEFLVEQGDYLISMDGEFRVSSWRNGKALLNQRVSRLIFFVKEVGQRFIAESLQARLSKLQGVKAYTTVDHLSGTQITESVIGLPPLDEQHRIVAKVDQLMALCDQLEQQQSDSIKGHETLIETLLGTLTRVASPQELSGAWTRIAKHFDTLFTTEHSIDQLKKAILQLAVMGKLVPQDPNDEPASVLLDKLRGEKQQLITKGLLKAEKPLPPLTNDEKEFPLPQGWAWVKFGVIAEFINGDRSKNYPNRSEYVADGVPWINTGHIEPYGRLTSKDMNFISREKFDSLSSGKIKKGDLVYCLRGATFGKTAFVEPYEEGAIASSLMIIRPFVTDLGKYIFHFLVSPFGKKQLYRFDNGSAQPNLSAGNVMLYACALPPLAEQSRIVAKIDELTALCDALNVRIKDSETIQIYLADAIVEQAVA